MPMEMKQTLKMAKVLFINDFNETVVFAALDFAFSAFFRKDNVSSNLCRIMLTLTV
eukprot:gene1088-1641_t